MDDERERVWFEVTADIDPLSPILDWWVTVDRRIVGGGWPTWEDAPAATALRCVAAISGLMESWLHPAAAARYAPIPVEAGGETGWVQEVAADGWWVFAPDAFAHPVILREDAPAVMVEICEEDQPWWTEAAAVISAHRERFGAVVTWEAGA